MSRISPCLWFSSEAEEAAKFYVSLLPDSRIEKIQRNTVDSPGGKAGTVGSIGQRRESTVPAIEHYAHESGQVSLCPRYGCELICFARKYNLDAQLRQINPTGKSVKTCPALGAKIFCFRSHPNH